MDPAEAIFKRLARLWGRLRGAAGHAEGEVPGAVALASCRDRLEVLAALLSGDAMEVRGADDGIGGVTGSVLVLPWRMAVVPGDAEANLTAYLVRVAYSCSVRELGLHLPRDAEDELDAAVATLMAVPLVRAHLTATYPAGAARERWLCAQLASVRPAVVPGSAGGVLEAWTRRLLCHGAPGEGEDLPVEQRAFVDGACAAPARSAEEVRAQVPVLRERLQACTQGRGGTPPPGVPLWGRLLAPPAASPVEEGPPVNARDEEGPGERRVLQLARTLRLRRHVHRRREDKPLYHMFEKVETAEEHRGEGGTPDAEGDVRQMEDALRGLSLGTVIRTTDDPRNLVRAEVIMDDPGAFEAADEAPKAGPRVFRYPEWDHKRQRYQPDHCTVVEERWVGDEESAEARALREVLRGQRPQVDALRTHLLRALYRRRMRDRQLDGPDIDVEAMVARHADLTAGRTPPERLYVAARKALREVAILVLVDTSFSTDAWLEGRRVLDVEMQSLLILAEAFAGHLEEEVAVAGFRSHTRHDVRFGVLKGFDDGWGALRRAAPALVPGGYTRIGAALRHASALLEATRARRRLLLVLSDGKPTDYDRYEGQYGVEDVRRAVREAGQGGAHVFGLAVEKEAKRHLARMLGPGRYRVLPQPSRLPDAMAEVFVGMMTG